jgi:uncharacterized Tic20 family protein
MRPLSAAAIVTHADRSATGRGREAACTPGLGLPLLSVQRMGAGSGHPATARRSNEEEHMMDGLQKIGGAAALAMAATWVVAFAVLLGVLTPAGYFDEGVAAVERASIIADNQAMASIGYLIPYVAWGILLVVLALALHDLLKVGAPALAQIATAIGLIWATLVIASGLVATLGIRVVGELHATDATQAGAVWAPVETVAGGLGGEAAEILGGVWLLLLAWAGLRTRELPRALSLLAIVLGVAGVLTVVPPLKELALSLYGLGLIVWFVWLGSVMLRTSRGRENQRLAGDLA